MPKAEVAEPTVSLEAFEQRCKALAIKFGDLLAVRRGEVSFVPTTNSTLALMTLSGRASEVAERNQGRQHNVAALCQLTEDVFAWVGYRERWRKELAERNFRFVDGGFTLHIGRQGELRKPQILRSEWAGRRSAAFVDLAGHPHWQFDALESVRGGDDQVLVRFGESEAEPIVQEFGQERASAKSNNPLLRLTVEKMHLASAALWWRQHEVQVAHSPETVAELDRWVLGCAAYLRQEVARCAIVEARR